MRAEQYPPTVRSDCSPPSLLLSGSADLTCSPYASGKNKCRGHGNYFKQITSAESQLGMHQVLLQHGQTGGLGSPDGMRSGGTCWGLMRKDAASHKLQLPESSLDSGSKGFKNK